jgi:undecaprenyl-diphosphatase
MINSDRRQSFLERIKTNSFQKWLVPAAGFVALAIACGENNFVDNRAIAKLFSGDYYRGFIVLGAVLLAYFAFRQRSLRLLLGYVLMIVSCLVITNVLKYSLHLPRPPRIKHGMIIAGYSAGFPSAHTAFAFGLAWLLMLRLPRLSLLWFGFAVAVGWSRIELRSHYPYQVLVGALLGMALGWWIGEKQSTIFPRLPFCPVLPKPAEIAPASIPEIRA